MSPDADKNDMPKDIDPETQELLSAAGAEFVDVPDFVVVSDVVPMVGMLPDDEGYPEAAVFVRLEGTVKKDDASVSQTYFFSPRDLLRVCSYLQGLAIEMEDAMTEYSAKNPKPKARIQKPASPYL